MFLHKDLSTLGTPPSDSIKTSKCQLKIKTQWDVNPQQNRHSEFATLPGCRVLYHAAWAKHGNCLTTNDNPDL